MTVVLQSGVLAVLMAMAMAATGYAAGSARNAPNGVKAVSDIQSMVLRADGSYEVTCRSGSTEVATPDQIQANDVCHPPAPTRVTAVFQRAEGDFFVLCVDNTWQFAATDAIQAGTVCQGPAVPATVVSDGTATKPYCSWANTCTWDDAAKAECAHHLCLAAGYAGGTFVVSSNDPCTSSATDAEVYAWELDKDVIASAQFGRESVITASCH